MFKFTNIVMKFAPIGVGAAIAYTVGHMGLGILVNLAKLLRRSTWRSSSSSWSCCCPWR